MNCLKCGQNNAPNARYCARCGQVLPAVARSALAPGQTMDNGQYRIVRQLGKGGMGAVYIAQNTQAFDRLCIIKEMIAYYLPGEEAQARERFIHEARILAALKHPNIPDMYGFFSEAGHNYIVMEYIEGPNLDQLLETGGGKIAVEDAVRYAVEISRVLEYLAAAKPEPVVHCDIKPANIIVDQNSGQAVLVDFGTAHSRYLNLNSSQPDSRSTAAYGTVGYAPPELYRGEATPKTDVFSLAATLYHLASGDDPRDHPFRWPGMSALPAPLREILERALAADIDQRLSAEQFRKALEDWRVGINGQVTPLTFPDGNRATTLTGLLDLALRNWEYAGEILYDGSLSAWLETSLGDGSAAKRAQEAVRQFPRMPNGGLDAFLREMNPRIPAPAVAAAPQLVTLGTIPLGDAPIFSVTLTNGGPAGCRGSVELPVPWLTCEEPQYALAPGESKQFTFKVRNVGNLPAGVPQEASVQFKHAVGLPTPFRVQVQAAAPAAQPQTRAPRKPQMQVVQAAPKLRWQRWLPILVGILAALGLAAFAYNRLAAPSDAAVQGAVESLAGGSYQQAFAILERIPASNTDQVELSGKALDALLVDIPPGEVFLGGRDTLNADGVTAQVSSFAIQRFEVTNVQWQRYVASGGTVPSAWNGSSYPAGQALRPVTGITQALAKAYAAWAGLRLPGEAEWMLAARGADGREYPWGNEDDPTGGNYLSSRQSETRLANIGSYQRDRTPAGIYDLAGNVREWTADFYAPYQIPHAPPAEGREAVVVGSSFASYDQALWTRQRVAVAETAQDLGFRCAR